MHFFLYFVCDFTLFAFKTCQISFMEIYNEQIRDLLGAYIAVTPVYSWNFGKPSRILDFRLSPGRETTDLKACKSTVVAVVLSEKSTFFDFNRSQVRDHPELGAYVPGLTEAPCSEACSLWIFLKIRYHWYHWYHFKYRHNQFYLRLFEVFSDSWFSCASNKLTTTSDQRCEELVGLWYQKVLSLVHSHTTKNVLFPQMSTWPTSTNRRVTAVTNMNAGSSRSHAVRTLWFKWLPVALLFLFMSKFLEKVWFPPGFYHQGTAAYRTAREVKFLQDSVCIFGHFSASPVFPVSCECSPDQGPSQPHTERMIERRLRYHQQCQIGLDIASWIMWLSFRCILYLFMIFNTYMYVYVRIYIYIKYYTYNMHW